MREGYRLYQIFIEPQAARDGSRDLRNFKAVCQARAKKIAFVVDEHLSLVFEAAERGRVNDAVAVALEFRAADRRRFAYAASVRRLRVYRVGSKFNHDGPNF